MDRTVSAEELRVFKAGGEMPNVNALYSSFKAARTANNALTDEIAELRANLERLQTSTSQPNLVHNIPTTPPVPPVRPSSKERHEPRGGIGLCATIRTPGTSSARPGACSRMTSRGPSISDSRRFATLQ